MWMPVMNTHYNVTLEKKLISHNLNVRMFFWGRILIGCIIWMRNFIFDFFELEKVENYLRVLIPIEWKYTTPPPPPPLVRISFVCVCIPKSMKIRQSNIHIRIKNVFDKQTIFGANGRNSFEVIVIMISN